jgi:hypothetical protein
MEKEFTQKEFSEYVLNGLIASFPKFNDYYRFETDVLIIEYPSIKGNLILWISSQNNELTIGFDQNNQCIWHTHMSQFGAYEPEDELKELIKFTKRIFEGEEKIVFDLTDGIYVTDSEIPENKLEVKEWKEL